MTNPLLLPPMLVKRALDDLHDLAGLARSLGTLPGKLDRLHEEIRGLRSDLEPLPDQMAALNDGIGGVNRTLDPVPAKLDGVQDLLEPMQELEPVRRATVPLEGAILSVREAVDGLEPMLERLDASIRELQPRLDGIHGAVEPIGSLADRLPGSGRRNRS